MDDFEAIGGPFDGEIMSADIGRKKSLALSWPIHEGSVNHYCYLFDRRAKRAFYRGVIQAEVLPELKQGT